MMSEMVERVARALCEAIGFPADGNVLDGDQIKIGWHTQIPKARAAIEALRLPTDAMVGAGHAEIKPDNLPADAGDARQCWRAMIDAALRDS